MPFTDQSPIVIPFSPGYYHLMDKGHSNGKEIKLGQIPENPEVPINVMRRSTRMPYYKKLKYVLLNGKSGERDEKLVFSGSTFNISEDGIGMGVAKEFPSNFKIEGNLFTGEKTIKFEGTIKWNYHSKLEKWCMGIEVTSRKDELQEIYSILELDRELETLLRHTQGELEHIRMKIGKGEALEGHIGRISEDMQRLGEFEKKLDSLKVETMENSSRFTERVRRRLLEFKTSGIEYIDELIRFTNVFKLMNKQKIVKEFEDLLRERGGSIEKELKTFTEVVEYLLYDAGPMEKPAGLEEAPLR